MLYKSLSRQARIQSQVRFPLNCVEVTNERKYLSSILLLREMSRGPNDIAGGGGVVSLDREVNVMRQPLRSRSRNATFRTLTGMLLVMFSLPTLLPASGSP